jgi:hypothetical protein
MFWRRKTPTKPPYEEQRVYVIKSIRDFLKGTGGKWEWDDFMSIPTGYPELETVQKFCLTISDEYPPIKRGGWCNAEGLRELERKLDELEHSDFVGDQNLS